MQPLKILNNVQKARLLHSLLYTEIPPFLAHLRETTDHVLAEADTVRQNWNAHLLSADLWLSLARETQQQLSRYGKTLENSSPVFAEQLFSGYTALYTVQQLINYSEQADTDPKFAQAVELLFG
jgi:hypothetical protein